VLTLLEKNYGGALAEGTQDLLPADARGWARDIGDALDRLAFHEALEHIGTLVGRANKYAEDTAPWKLVKTDPARAQRVLSEMARALKAVAVALHPFMPSITPEIWRQLGETAPFLDGARALFADGRVGFAPGQKIAKGSPLFPRKDA